jgi:hypothetical protein
MLYGMFLGFTLGRQNRIPWQNFRGSPRFRQLIADCFILDNLLFVLRSADFRNMKKEGMKSEEVFYSSWYRNFIHLYIVLLTIQHTFQT